MPLSCVLTAFYQFTLCFFYFIYFLFKGKPEWQKVTKEERCSTQSCCLHNPKVHFEISSKGSPNPGSLKSNIPNPNSSSNSHNRMGSEVPTNINSNETILKRYTKKIVEFTHPVGSSFISLLLNVFYFLQVILCWLILAINRSFSWIFTKKVQDNVQTQRVERIKSSSMKEEIKHEVPTVYTSEVTNLDKPSTGVEISKKEKLNESEKRVQSDAGQFYSLKESIPKVFENDRINESDDIPHRALLETFEVPIKESNGEISSSTDKMPKGAVAVLPPEIMAEAHARVKERERKISGQSAKETNQYEDEMNTDWTVTSRRMIPEWQVKETKEMEKTNEEGNGVWRTTGNSVVSRIPHGSDQDAQFIFRAPKARHTSTTWVPEKSLPLGRSVFSPAHEVERVRSQINQQRIDRAKDDRYNSRIQSPTGESKTGFMTTVPKSTNKFEDAYRTSRSQSQTRLRSLFSPPTSTLNYPSKTESDDRRLCMLRQRSRTVEPRSESTVKAISRRWPPESNATGVEVAKDNWNVPSEIVSCKRVFERSVTDKWTTRDKRGNIVDEWSTQCWKGERDGLKRKGNSGEVWHQEVHVSPQGKTSFLNNRCYYTKDYVIESEARST